MKKHAIAFFLVCFAFSSTAEEKIESWVIYPGKSDSPTIEVWVAGEHDQITWKLRSKTGSIIVEKRAPSLPPNYEIVSSFCVIDGQERNDALVAVEKNNINEYHTSHLGVWIASPEKAEFILTNPKSVSCFNESH